MTSVQVNVLVREAAPTCGVTDGCSDRYRVWVTDNGPVVKARTKRELAKLLKSIEGLVTRLERIDVFVTSSERVPVLVPALLCPETGQWLLTIEAHHIIERAKKEYVSTKNK